MPHKDKIIAISYQKAITSARNATPGHKRSYQKDVTSPLNAPTRAQV